MIARESDRHLVYDRCERICVSPDRSSPFCSTRVGSEVRRRGTPTDFAGKRHRKMQFYSGRRVTEMGQGTNARAIDPTATISTNILREETENILPVLLRVLAILHGVAAAAAATGTAIGFTVFLEILLGNILTEVLVFLLISHCLRRVSRTRCVNDTGREDRESRK